MSMVEDAIQNKADEIKKKISGVYLYGKKIDAAARIDELIVAAYWLGRQEAEEDAKRERDIVAALEEMKA